MWPLMVQHSYQTLGKLVKRFKEKEETGYSHKSVFFPEKNENRLKIQYYEQES